MRLAYAAARAIRSVTGGAAFLFIGSLTSREEVEQLSHQIGRKEMHSGIMRRKPHL